MEAKVHAFPQCISLKAKVIVWLEFELTYSLVTVQHFSHYTRDIPWMFMINIVVKIQEKVVVIFICNCVKYKKNSLYKCIITDKNKYENSLMKTVPFGWIVKSLVCLTSY